MRNFKDKLITFILLIFIIVVFGGTILFCLDIFGIIELPEEYSLINIIYSNKKENSNIGTEDINITSENKTIEVATIDTSTNTSSVQENNYQGGQIILNELTTPTTVQNTTIANKFYYEQLDSYGKIIYDGLYKHKNDLKSGTYTIEFDKSFNKLLQEENGAEILNNAFQLAVNSFLFDNPDLFYVDVPKMYLLTEITTKTFSKTYRVSIGANDENYLYPEFTNRAALDYAVNQIEETKNYILSNAVGSDYDKVKYVHDYLVDNVEYIKSEGSEIYTIYGPLLYKRAVCEGYAKTFKYILDNMGIPCVIVCGIGRNSNGETESHAWNYVQLNGNWYAVDITWDDPIIIGNGYVSEDIKYEYFLKGSNIFFEDHLEDGAIIDGADFKYPKLSVIDY